LIEIEISSLLDINRDILHYLISVEISFHYLIGIEIFLTTGILADLRVVLYE